MNKFLGFGGTGIRRLVGLCSKASLVPMEFAVLRLFAIVLVALMLAGCLTEALHSELKEKEANEMVAILHNQGIYGNKSSQGKGLYTVMVASNQFAFAVQTLRRAGYPRPKRVNLGDLFKPSGLVPTPTEERVRYIHGLSRELAGTIRQISGITQVRVHIALASNEKNSGSGIGQTGSSKASVLIEYDPEKVLLGTLIPRIKRLVGDSVPKLTNDEVVVLAQENTRFEYDQGQDTDRAFILGVIEMNRKDYNIVLGAVVILFLLAVGQYVLAIVLRSKA